MTVEPFEAAPSGASGSRAFTARAEEGAQVRSFPRRIAEQSPKSVWPGRLP